MRKHFGGTQALQDVSLSIGRGTVHGLVGENGAGKSTLGKIVAGVHRPDAGEVLVEGRPVEYHSPRDALADGLTIIAQELALVPGRSVVENVFLGAESSRAGFVHERAMLQRYEALDTFGFGLDPGARVGSLRVADQQKVEILRAIGRESRLIVMDEPTASLGRDDAEKLFGIVRKLTAQGTTIVFVSHSLGDVLALCDEATVLKDGKLVRTGPASAETSESLVLGMVGRSLELTFPPKRRPPPESPVVLSVEGLSVEGLVRDASLQIREGEIVGLAGLIGSGRSELAAAVFGALPRSAGTVELGGRLLEIRSPRQAVRAGIGMLPESRKDMGLVMRRPIVENVTLPHLRRISLGGLVRTRRERSSLREIFEQVGVPAGRVRDSVDTLSGGNQQKVLFSKWLYGEPRLLIADEPTRGVDVGAKRAIYELLVRLADAGLAILLISSELEEVVGLSHRIVVMREGRLVSEVDAELATGEGLLGAAFGTLESMAAGGTS